MRRLLAALLLPALLAACGTPEDTRPGQPVKHRQQAFKELIRHFEPMGTMLRDNRYDADKFLALAENLASRRDAPWPYFGPETDYPPSKSKAEVWSQAAEFDQARQSFIAASDRLLAAARSKDKASIEKSYQETYDTCQGCHRRFRER